MRKQEVVDFLITNKGYEYEHKINPNKKIGINTELIKEGHKKISLSNKVLSLEDTDTYYELKDLKIINGRLYGTVLRLII